MSERYCYSCMNTVDREHICPHCGANPYPEQKKPMLPLQHRIHQRYLIGRCVEVWGDGYTYIGRDTAQNHKVYIREFFPQPIVQRTENDSVITRTENKDEYDEYLADFQDMAKKLMKLNDQSAIMPVYDIVWANNTIYCVTEYIENVPLSEAVESAKGKGIAWAGVRSLFDEFLGSLAAMHRLGIVHRGICPDTLLLCSDGKLRMTGFCIPAARMEGRGLHAKLAEGFTAPEQFAGSPYPDSSSDLYSVCATLFYTLTGTRYQAGELEAVLYPADLPQYVLKVLKKGMRPDPEQRFANAEELKAALNDERIAAGGFVGSVDLTDKLEGYELGDETPVNEKKHKSRVKVVMLTTMFGVLVLAIVVVLALYVFLDVNIFTAGLYQVSSNTTSSYIQSEENKVSTGVTTVPNLLGLHLNDIAEQIDPEKFTVEYQMSGFNNTYGRNYVMKQSPEPGSPSPGKTTLVLTISRGPEYVVMPQLEGLSVEQAAMKLDDLGMQMVLMAMPNITAIDHNGDGITDEYQLQEDTDGDGIADSSRTVTPGIVLQSLYKKNQIVKAESAILLYAVPLPVTSSSSAASSAASGVSKAGSAAITSSQVVVSWTSDASAYGELVSRMNTSSQTTSIP